jgi:hypothetical protein
MPFCMRRIANSQGGPGVCDWERQTGQGAICSSQALDGGSREVNRRVPYLPIQDGHGKQSEDCTAGRKEACKLHLGDQPAWSTHMVVGQ